MQNGSAAKDENSRSIGQLYSAIHLRCQQTVRGVGVRTVNNRTSSPQVGHNGSRSTVSILGRIPPMRQTTVSIARGSIRPLQCLHEPACLQRLRCFPHHNVYKEQACRAIHGESSNMTHSVVCES